ncbi:HEAT repeat-containing protein 3, partial [Stegodyphus mimosarum]
MGKSKAQKSKIRKNNPIGIPSMKELEEREELMITNFETGTVESIIDKLQSRAADDKECAAFTIANMADNPKFVASLLENKVIRIAAPLLVDRNVAVRHAIAGCLRNLAACGDHSVSQAMVDQDILTSLVTLFQQYKDPWAPCKSLENKTDSKTEIFLEACNLLWSLCENSDTAVAVFNTKNLVSILLPCLDISVYDLQIPLAVAQCLHTVVEDNSEVIEVLKQPLVLEQLKALMCLSPTEPEHTLLKTLAAGIVLNLFSATFNDCMNDISVKVLEVVASTLDEPVKRLLDLLAEQISSHKLIKLDKYHDEKDLEEKEAAVNKTVKHLDHVLPAKQIALEILTNVCFGNDSSDDWEDLSSSDASDEAEMDVDETEASLMKLGLRIPSEIHGIIVNGKFLEKVIDQIITPSDEVYDVIKGSSLASECLKRLNTVKSRALLCLNNLIHGLELEDLGGPPKLFELWYNIGELLFKKTDTSNIEQLEAVTSSMRAVLKKLAETDCSSEFSCTTERDLDLLIDMYQTVQEPSIKVNIIHALGTIGCLLENLKLPTTFVLIGKIGSFLLDVASKDSHIWVVAEALDILLDVFAEDHLDLLAQRICLVEKLTNMLQFLKGRIKQQRKSLGEHLPLIITVKTNLLRFIKYKNDCNKK